MKKSLDINDKEILIKGNVIDIHQTVNGENIFVIKEIDPLDIRYGRDISRVYEYDMEELIYPGRYDIVENEVIGNLYDI